MAKSGKVEPVESGRAEEFCAAAEEYCSEGGFLLGPSEAVVPPDLLRLLDEAEAELCHIHPSVEVLAICRDILATTIGSC